MKRLVFCLALGLLPACSANKAVTKRPAPAADAGQTYVGTLPCPLDCQDARTALTLYKNHRFSMEETFRSRTEADRVEQSRGEWALTDGNIYELTSDQFDHERFFLRVNDDVLRALDDQGRELTTKENVSLKRMTNP